MATKQDSAASLTLLVRIGHAGQVREESGARSAVLHRLRPRLRGCAGAGVDLNLETFV